MTQAISTTLAPQAISAVKSALELAEKQATRLGKPCGFCGAEWKPNALFHHPGCAVNAIFEALAVLGSLGNGGDQ